MTRMSRAELERAYAEVRSEPACPAVLDWRVLCAKREKAAETIIRYLESRTPRCPPCSGTGKSPYLDTPCYRCKGTGI